MRQVRLLTIPAGRELRAAISRLLVLCLACVAVSPAVAAEKAAKYALLVGVTKYSHADMNRTPLKFPEADAKAVGDLLRASGYTVKLLLGKAATQKAIAAELAVAGRQGAEDGAVLIGLFGHGVQYGEDAFFGPYDTGIRTVKDATGQVIRDGQGRPKLEPDPGSMVAMRSILDALTTCGAGNRVLLADCCREDPSVARGRAFGSRLKLADLPAGTAALFACRAGERAFEHDDWQHGAFTKALLDEWRSGSTPTVNEMSAAVHRSVRQMVREKTNGRSRQTVNPLVNGIVELKLERSGPAPFDATTARSAAEAQAAQLAWARSLGQSEPTVSNSVGMKFAIIPPGEFQMGPSKAEEKRTALQALIEGDPSWTSSESPLHRVRITRPYFLQTTEVTQGQWKAVMGTEPWRFEKDVRHGDHLAATYISWEDAQLFCRKLGEKEGATYRLPTEAEWEYACRAGTTTRYHFGDSEDRLGEYAWFYDNAWDIDEKYAHQVGRKKPNAWGLFDMHGNASELCRDAFDKDYYRQFASRTAVDPQGPSSGDSDRVGRGGCWFSSPSYCRAANRSRYSPGSRIKVLGMRVVREVGGK